MAAELVVGDLRIQSGSGLVEAGDRVLAMSVREFELLVALASRAGRIVRREELFALVWRAPLRHGDRSVDVYVHKLRVKLEQALPELQFIHTHVGFGYRFAPAPAAAPNNDHEESL
jgi:DNA-binding response OmpR family regulator